MPFTEHYKAQRAASAALDAYWRKAYGYRDAWHPREDAILREHAGRVSMARMADVLWKYGPKRVWRSHYAVMRRATELGVYAIPDGYSTDTLATAMGVDWKRVRDWEEWGFLRPEQWGFTQKVFTPSAVSDFLTNCDWLYDATKIRDQKLRVVAHRALRDPWIPQTEMARLIGLTAGQMRRLIAGGLPQIQLARVWRNQMHFRSDDLVTLKALAAEYRERAVFNQQAGNRARRKLMPAA